MEESKTQKFKIQMPTNSHNHHTLQLREAEQYIQGTSDKNQGKINY
jgi:hypothetical protein